MSEIIGLVGPYAEVAAQVLGKVGALKQRMDSCHNQFFSEHTAIYEDMGILQAEINEVAAVLRNHINLDQMVHEEQLQELARMDAVEVVPESTELASVQTELHAIACAICQDARPTVLQVKDTVTGSKRPLMLVDATLIDKMRSFTNY